MTSETVSVVVARGKPVLVGDRTFLPGETCQIPAADYQLCLNGGFIVNPDDPDGPQVVRTTSRLADSPSSIGLQQSTER
jgi:hypothetical protein